MSTDSPQRIQAAVPAAPPLAIKELVALLIKHHGFHEGQFDLLLEYQFGVGAFGPSPAEINPGVMIGIAKLGLTRSVKPGPLTVNAADVNPEPKRKKRKGPSGRTESDA